MGVGSYLLHRSRTLDKEEWVLIEENLAEYEEYKVGVSWREECGLLCAGSLTVPLSNMHETTGGVVSRERKKSPPTSKQQHQGG